MELAAGGQLDRHRIALHLHLQHAAFWWMLSTWETSCRFFSATGALSSRGLWPAGQSTTATSPRRDGNQTLHLVYLGPRRHPCLETTENQGACCVVCRNEGVGPLCEWTSGDYCDLSTILSLRYLLLEVYWKLACRSVTDIIYSPRSGNQAAVRFQYIKRSV